MTQTESSVAKDAEDNASLRKRMPRWVLPTVRATFTMAVLLAVAFATASQWSEVREYLSGLSWPSVAGSFLLILFATFTAAMGWRAALANFGHRVPVRTASQIYLIGVLAKYLPGSLWAFVLQMELGKRANLPRSRPLLASITYTGYGATSALVFGMFAFPALFQLSGGLAIVGLLLVPIALFCAQPKVLGWLLRRLTAIARRPAEFDQLTWRGAAPVMGWAVASEILLGMHLWLLVGAGSGAVGLARATGAIGIGLALGMLSFLAPSGLGVREAIIVAALVPYMPAGAALGLALTSRLLFTVGDLVAAAVAAGTAIPLLRVSPSRG